MSSLSLSSFLTSSSIHQFLFMYGIQIVVCLTLIAITIFRKEMSCNHCYSSIPSSLSSTTTTTTTPSSSQSSNSLTIRKRKGSGESSSSPLSSTTATTTSNMLLDDTMDDMKTESLLEEAGCYGSGTYTLFINTIRLLRRILFHYHCHSSNNTNFYYYCYSNTFLVLPYHMWDAITLWWTVAAEERHLEDILDGADHWCVLGPHSHSITSSSSSPGEGNITELTTTLDDMETRKRSRDACCIFPTCIASQSIPNDVLVHIFSHLYPRDIISFSCTNSNIFHTLLDHHKVLDDHVVPKEQPRSSHHHELSHTLWKTLWYRDYGWLLTRWDVGRVALEQSFSQYRRHCGDDDNDAMAAAEDDVILLSCSFSSLEDIVFTPKLYFRFGLSYVNYLIAGHCNRHQCLIGLGGHIYDLTTFVDHHPGSSETLLVHSGRDVSYIFETMRHTISARIMAEQFCIVVDTSLLSNGVVGARPTRHLVQNQVSLSTSDIDHLTPAFSAAVSHRCHTNRSLPSTLECIYETFLEEQELYERQAKILQGTLSPDTLVGDVHVYYDPMIEEWKGWYMNTNFESVFIEF